MSAFKGTPGPWHVGAQNDLLYVIERRPATSNDYPDHNADVAAVAKFYCGNESEANARLIAAAPDLLEALMQIRSASRRYLEEQAPSDAEWASGEPSVLEVVDAAIAKATGGEA